MSSNFKKNIYNTIRIGRSSPCNCYWGFNICPNHVVNKHNVITKFETLSALFGAVYHGNTSLEKNIINSMNESVNRRITRNNTESFHSNSLVNKNINIQAIGPGKLREMKNVFDSQGRLRCTFCNGFHGFAICLRKQNKCFKCHQSDHFIKHCPELKNSLNKIKNNSSFNFDKNSNSIGTSNGLNSNIALSKDNTNELNVASSKTDTVLNIKLDSSKSEICSSMDETLNAVLPSKLALKSELVSQDILSNNIPLVLNSENSTSELNLLNKINSPDITSFNSEIPLLCNSNLNKEVSIELDSDKSVGVNEVCKQDICIKDNKFVLESITLTDPDCLRSDYFKINCENSKNVLALSKDNDSSPQFTNNSGFGIKLNEVPFEKGINTLDIYKLRFFMENIIYEILDCIDYECMEDTNDSKSMSDQLEDSDTEESEIDSDMSKKSNECSDEVENDCNTDLSKESSVEMNVEDKWMMMTKVIYDTKSKREILSVKTGVSSKDVITGVFLCLFSYIYNVDKNGIKNESFAESMVADIKSKIKGIKREVVKEIGLRKLEKMDFEDKMFEYGLTFVEKEEKDIMLHYSHQDANEYDWIHYAVNREYEVIYVEIKEEKPNTLITLLQVNDRSMNVEFPIHIPSDNFLTDNIVNSKDQQSIINKSVSDLSIKSDSEQNSNSLVINSIPGVELSSKNIINEIEPVIEATCNSIVLNSEIKTVIPVHKDSCSPVKTFLPVVKDNHFSGDEGEDIGVECRRVKAKLSLEQVWTVGENEFECDSKDNLFKCFYFYKYNLDKNGVLNKIIIKPSNKKIKNHVRLINFELEDCYDQDYLNCLSIKFYIKQFVELQNRNVVWYEPRGIPNQYDLFSAVHKKPIDTVYLIIARGKGETKVSLMRNKDTIINPDPIADLVQINTNYSLKICNQINREGNILRKIPQNNITINTNVEIVWKGADIFECLGIYKKYVNINGRLPIIPKTAKHSEKYSKYLRKAINLNDGFKLGDVDEGIMKAFAYLDKVTIYYIQSDNLDKALVINAGENIKNIVYIMEDVKLCDSFLLMREASDNCPS